jgi:hypothetical protein
MPRHFFTLALAALVIFCSPIHGQEAELGHAKKPEPPHKIVRPGNAGLEANPNKSLKPKEPVKLPLPNNHNGLSKASGHGNHDGHAGGFSPTTTSGHNPGFSSHYHDPESDSHKEDEPEAHNPCFEPGKSDVERSRMYCPGSLKRSIDEKKSVPPPPSR